MIQRFRTRWNAFFFAEEVPYGMALVRITLPLVLLIGVLWRWAFVRELYSTDGSPTPLWVNYGSGPMVPELSAPVAVALFTILAASLVTVCIGWMTRTSLAAACVLYTAFGLLDSVGTLTKYTVIGAHLLLLLALSDSGAVWSVDAWFRRRTGGARLDFGPRTSAVWPRRLVQLLIGLVYMGAAFTKMHTPAYFSGDQLTFWMLADTNFDNPFGELLTLYPPLLTVMAYVTIVWEVLFVYLVWSSVWRVPALALGVIFHVLTYFTLGLIEFPLIYLAAYFAFLDPSEADRAVVFCKRTLRRLGVPKLRRQRIRGATPSSTIRPASAIAGWGMLMAALAVMGVEAEHRLDVYGNRSTGRPLPLKELEPEQVAEMLGPSRRLRPKDMYYAFDVGTKTLGGLLSDRREAFAYGEQAIVQCSLQPPHPDMWVEVNLHDGEDRVLRRIGQVVPRENLRAEFFFPFDESFLPGTYDFVLRYDGAELTRRRVMLEGQSPELTASR
ncbi:MAG: HTTM domain-containing protein [Planctomycetaceae bacterium]